MEINWFTFFAQIVNFFVLVFVLQRLLYKPIIKAMERREKTIRDRLESAAQQQQEAQQEKAYYQQMQTEFAAQQGELMVMAKLEVEQTRKKLLQEVEDAAVKERGRWQASLQRQKSSFLQELRLRTVQQLQTIARSVLQNLAEVTLEEQIAKVFLKRLQYISDRDRANLVSALSHNNGDTIVLSVLSTFELPEEIRTAIANILGNYFHEAGLGNVQLNYEIQTDLICGIELRGAGYKLPRSIDSYLDSMTDNLASVLDEEIGTEVSGKGTKTDE
jgi:F-type H+-transporting ATPase subunit b